MVFNESDIKIETWKLFGNRRSMRVTHIPTNISVFRVIEYKSNKPITETRNELFEKLKDKVMKRIVCDVK